MAQLNIIQGEESSTDIKILSKMLQESKAIAQPLPYLQIESEDHQTVFLPALNKALKDFYIDYLEPGERQLVAEKWRYQDLDNFIKRRSKNYQLEVNSQQLQAMTTSLAQTYLDAKEFSLAFEYWDKSESRFKAYFLNRAADRFWQLNEQIAAVKTLERLKQYFPESPLSYYKLSSWYQVLGDLKLAKDNSRKLSNLIKSISSNSSESQFNQLGYYLIEEKQLDMAVRVLEKVANHFPNSANAFDSLGYAYEKHNKYTEASNAYFKAVELSKKAGSNQVAYFETNYQRMIAALQHR